MASIFVARHLQVNGTENKSYTKPTNILATANPVKRKIFVEETVHALNKGLKSAKFDIFCSKTKVLSATTKPRNENGLKKTSSASFKRQASIVV